MFTHQFKIISIAALLSILLITCGLPSILPPKQSEKYSRGIGYSDAQGRAAFQDKVSGTKSNIKVVDADTRQPVSNIRVEYLSNGKRMLVVAYDESGQYIYSIYEGPIPSTSSINPIGVSVAMAQSLEEITLDIIHTKGRIDTFNDISSLVRKYQIDETQWNFFYHENCWTHEELKKLLSLELTVVKVIFFSAFPVGAPEIEKMSDAIFDIASEGVSLSDPYQYLPDPVRLRIYHVPTFLSGVVFQPLGACQVSEATPPVSGGFGTLMAQQPSSIVEAPTITPPLSEAQQLPDDIVEVPTIEPAPESPIEAVQPSGSDISSIVGVWRGSITNIALGIKSTYNVKYKIKTACQMGEPCLYIEGWTHPHVYDPTFVQIDREGNSGYLCFLYESDFKMHYCFRSLSDGNLLLYATWTHEECIPFVCVEESGILTKVGD